MGGKGVALPVPPQPFFQINSWWDGVVISW
jgi:hypothetical protein